MSKTLPLGPLMADVASIQLSEAEREFLCHPAVGAVILFTRNYDSPSQLRQLVASIKKLRTPELLIAVDQEGGRVQRFRDQFVTLPPLRALGTAFDLSGESAATQAFKLGRLMALEICSYGIDFSFAPVLDIASADSQIIGDRGFHHNPETIALLAAQYIDGMDSAGMAATGKHFPGHGSVIEDSHLELPTDHRTLEDLRCADMIPYFRLNNRLKGIMTAHIAFPAIDAELPTYSRYWLQNILRAEIGYRGLIFSDDLTMQGAVGAGSPAERAHKALAAGCDMVLVCNDSQAAHEVADSVINIPASQPGLQAMRSNLFDSGQNTVGAIRDEIRLLASELVALDDVTV